MDLPGPLASDKIKKGRRQMKLRLCLKCSVFAMSALSLMAVVPANAQAPADNSTPVESVTVVGLETLERDAHISIADSINKLPSVGISATPNNSVSSGNLSQGDASL